LHVHREVLGSERMMLRFTYDWYSEFLRHCQNSGHISLLRDVEIGPLPKVILRHDVDFDLAAAHELSFVEELAGVRSTYLVLLSTHYYNVAAPKARQILQSLIARGFEIGLHFDPTVYVDDGPTRLTAGFAAERGFLESIIGAEVRSVSLHNPTSHGLYPIFTGAINAYDPRWFGPERYVSDSLGRWKHDPFALVSRARELGHIQVLCHPIHFAPEETTYRIALDRMAEAWRSEAHDYIYEKNQTYRDECISRPAGHGVSIP
jgi:hypothetical protein